MSRRDVSEWSPRSWTFRTQHPSLVLRIVELTQAARAELPVEAGCYVLMAPGIGRRYVGTATSLADRVVPSWRQNLPAATRVLCVTPSGLIWHEDQRLAIESLCIKRLDQCVNRSPGRRIVTMGTDADYIRSVAAEVACAVELACPVTGLAGSPRLSQGETARALVLAERHHPPTVRTLLETMRTLGWSATGHTPHRTLRRDLLDARRAGDRAGQIAIHGPWTRETHWSTSSAGGTAPDGTPPAPTGLVSPETKPEVSGRLSSPLLMMCTPEALSDTGQPAPQCQVL